MLELALLKSNQKLYDKKSFADFRYLKKIAAKLQSQFRGERKITSENLVGPEVAQEFPGGEKLDIVACGAALLVKRYRNKLTVRILDAVPRQNTPNTH